MQGIHEKIAVEITYAKNNADKKEKPYLAICDENGSNGIRYYSVPGGHEFNSFIIALYNTAGPGQKLGGQLTKRIKRYSGQTSITGNGNAFLYELPRGRHGDAENCGRIKSDRR